MTIVLGRRGGGKADSASAHACIDDGFHGSNFIIVRCTLGGGVTHDIGAKRRMTDEGRYIQRQTAPLDHVQIFRDRFK